VPNNQVFSDSLVIFKKNNFSLFSVLQSNIHFLWIINFFTTQGSTPVYIESKVLNNFPFPNNFHLQANQQLEIIGKQYHEFRKQLMEKIQLGLTKTYNLFHSKAITAQSINDKDKQLVALQKHFEKTANTISFDEAIKGILHLRELHVQMDEAVLDAYGWNDINLFHNFYDVDYLPENDRVRYTIHPEARKEVLKRLLQLNHERHAEEVAMGLFEKEQKVSTTKKKKSPKKKNMKGSNDLGMDF
jgi:hypothetical protein